MSPLVWNPKKTAGIRVMDEQHAILLDGLNELRTALKQGEECEVVRGLLHRVAQLARLHVASEERLLEQHHFPGLPAYRAERQLLLEQLEARPALCNSGNRFRQSDSVHELAEFLRSWFVAHTEEAGSAYGPWLQEHGVR
jgi:hemerythrin